MRGILTRGRLLITAGVIGVFTTAAAAADKSLEDRVKALEQKAGGAAASESEHKGLRDRIAGLEKEVLSTKDALAERVGLDVHGFVAASYNYNFNSPDSRQNSLRPFDKDTNTFNFDQGNLLISRNKEDENLGFVLNLDFGKVAENIGGRWSNAETSTEMTNSFEVREAYLTYKIPVFNGINLKAGRFTTLLGAEIIENWDNHNYNISRSYSFGFGVPYTNTGILANIPLTDMLSLDLAFVNGFDNVVDNNDGKSVMAGLGFTPSEMFSIYAATIYGPEQDNRGGSKRSNTTVVATFQPMDMLTFVAEGTYGNETKVIGENLNKDADWYATAWYVNVAPTDDLSVALRAEVFDDPDGIRGIDATVWELTPTVTYKLSEGLLVRAEYRHDEADKPVFEKEDRTARSQDTVAVQMIYSF